ncbi:MAG: acyl carrier protein [Spirochaetia bacterium]|jgi:acyl carrier protein
MGDLQENWNVEFFKNDIKQIVSRISRIDAEELDDELLIREELGIDSLMAMEIIATCEKLLSLKIDETLFADIQTVGDFFDLLIELSGRKVA